MRIQLHASFINPTQPGQPTPEVEIIVVDGQPGTYKVLSGRLGNPTREKATDAAVAYLEARGMTNITVTNMPKGPRLGKPKEPGRQEKLEEAIRNLDAADVKTAELYFDVCMRAVSSCQQGVGIGWQGVQQAITDATGLNFKED